MYKLFFRPQNPKSAAADFIPYYKDGTFHLFYLFDHRDTEKYGEGVTWYKIETNDFVNFIDKGQMIERGSISEEDMCAFTGSIIEADGKFHMFYTGHNSHIHTFGYQNECIMHAISDDLDHWTKIPSDTFYAPDGYDKCDFRDPYVYFDETNKLYYMLLCARTENGNALRKGQTIRMRSSNLSTWNFDKVLYAPQSFHTHECPDLFKFGDKWYLIFSEYSDRYTVCYRISDSPDGPWIKPKNDTFDGRAFYAAKTASDGNNRYLFGWIPTRFYDKDNQSWMWGGNLAVHKLVQNDDYSLSVCPPNQLINAIQQEFDLDNVTINANCDCKTYPIILNTPDNYYLSFDVNADCDKFGILLHHNTQQDAAYEFRFCLSEGKLSVNRFPRFPHDTFAPYGLERKISGKTFHIDLFVDDDIAVIYINQNSALSVRLCEKFGKETALYTADGTATFTNLRLKH